MEVSLAINSFSELILVSNAENEHFLPQCAMEGHMYCFYSTIHIQQGTLIRFVRARRS